MNTIEALEKTGYKIQTDGQEIKLSYQGPGDPDPSKVGPLIEDLKRHKRQALTILRERDTSRIFRDALHELSAVWVPGLLEHTRRHHSDTWELIQGAEESLERAWGLTLGGKMTMNDFEEAVTIWRDAYRLTIEEHRRGILAGKGRTGR